MNEAKIKSLENKMFKPRRSTRLAQGAKPDKRGHYDSVALHPSD